jgi:lysophospholipase L1-like esterase
MLLKIFVYLAALFSFSGFVSCDNDELTTGMSTDTTELYPPASLVIPYHTEWAKGHYPKRIEEFKNNPLKLGDIVFIGNSITEGGNDWSAKFGIANIKNRGIAGDVTDGVLKRLGEIIHYKPKKVFLLIGINDLFNLQDQKQIPSTDYIGNNILTIAKMISDKSPDTKIYVQTILPTDKVSMKVNITKVNDIIKAREADGKYKAIDLHAVFTDNQGLLKKELTYDGTHLNDAGYKEWVNFIGSIVKQ